MSVVGRLSITGDCSSLRKLYTHLINKRIYGVVESGKSGQLPDFSIWDKESSSTAVL